MRRILRAISAALAAATLWVVVRCEETGRLILRALGAQGPDLQMLADEYEDAAETAPVAPKPDQRLQNLQLAADALFRQRPVNDEWLVGMSEQRLEWLETLDADMLLKVARAKPEDLQEHLANRTTIRALLRFEPGAIADYRRAVELDREPPRPEPKPAMRTRRRQESLLPAFGPIC